MALLDLGGLNLLGNYSRIDHNRVDVSNDETNSKSWNANRGRRSGGRGNNGGHGGHGGHGKGKKDC